MLLHIYLLALAGVVLSHHHEYDHDHTIPIPEIEETTVPVEVLTGFQAYSLEIIRQREYIDAVLSKGISSTNTYTLGYLLAVIRERTLDLSAHGFGQVLRYPEGNITDSYVTITNSLVEDINVTSTSTLYTAVDNVVIMPAVKRLRTEKYLMSLYENPNEAVLTINERIANQTRQRIVDHLVPAAGGDVPGKPFYNSTQGVYVNTLYYKNSLERAFTNVGQRAFFGERAGQKHEEQVNTLESTGSYPVYDTAAFAAVAIPLQGNRKRLVFVQPKTTMVEFLKESVADIFTMNPSSWDTKTVRVQVPSLNYTLAHSYDNQLRQLGITKTFCKSAVEITNESNFLQPLVQVVSSVLTPDYFELAVTNGVQVNNIKVYHEEVPSVVSKSDVTDIPPKTETVVIKSRHVQDVDTAFIFEKPFFLYLHDDILSAISFTAISSTYPFRVTDDLVLRHHENPQDFTQEAIRHRWEC